MKRVGLPASAHQRRRTAWRTACQAAGVPTRFLHDCRRTAARNLIRASVPERVAMLLTGHKSRAIFDRYNIINEQELLDAGDQLVAYLAQQAQPVPARQRSHAATGRCPANGVEHGLPPHFLPLARHGVEGVPSRCQTPPARRGGAPVRKYSAGRLRRSPAGARRRPPARSSGCCITPASAWARVDHDNARRP